MNQTVDPALLRQAALITELFRLEYRDIRLLDGGLWAATFRFMFTHAIILGDDRNLMTYEDRWCYHDYEAARAALETWDGKYRPFNMRRLHDSSYRPGEPTGWHRHPTTGRRVDDEGRSYVSL